MNLIKKAVLGLAVGLLTTINLVGVVPISLESKAEANNAPSKTLRWTEPIRKGDCQLLDGTLTFYRDGTGQFTSKVRTFQTRSGDYWHIRFAIKNQPGAELFQLSEWTGPRMDDGNPPPLYTFNRKFAYNQAYFEAISYAVFVKADC